MSMVSSANSSAEAPTGLSAVLPPLSVMASWPPPNHINPPSRASMMIGAEVPLAVITTVIVTLRMFSRAYLTGSARSIFLDDWLMVAAVASADILTGLHLLQIKYGWGLHIWDVETAWITPTQKLVMATELLFCVVVTITKLSILAFYLRVFSAYKAFRRLCWVGVTFCFTWMVSVIGFGLNQCTPMRGFWDLTIPAKCVDMYAGSISLSALNSLSDFFLFVLPIRWVWMLQLPKKQRMGLIVAFSLGGAACVAGVARLHFLYMAYKGNRDATWHGAPSYVATSVEANVGIICASIPALKPLFVKIARPMTHAASVFSRSPAHGSSDPHGSSATRTIGGGTFGRNGMSGGGGKRGSDIREQGVCLKSLGSLEDGIHAQTSHVGMQRTVRDEEVSNIKSDPQVDVFDLGDDGASLGRSTTTFGEHGDQEKLWRKAREDSETMAI